MKKLQSIFTAVLMLLSFNIFAQTLTLTEPVDLVEPYEVQPGTQITVQWDYYNTEPTVILTYDQDPGDLGQYQYTLNSDWTEHSSGWSDNGDGTYSYTYSVSETTWIWGAYYTDNTGYQYSNIISISIASPAVAEYTDGLICPTGNDTELLSIADTFATYQWYHEGALIDGATSSTYNAAQAGEYYVEVSSNGTNYQSNHLQITEMTLSFAGSLDQVNNQLTLTSSETMESYQWYSGSDINNMTAISGATSQSYTVDITSSLTYYMLEGTSGSCVIQTEARPVEQSMFTPVEIAVAADTNSYNHVCEGTVITLSIDVDNSIFSDVDWYKNGTHTYGTDHITINSSYKTGNYYVITVPVEWPEVQVQSETVAAEYFEVTEPVLSGAYNNSYHCAGEDINITLSDEGYNYTWYVHESYYYHDTDIVSVPSGTYSFTFENEVYISVKAEFEGCEADNSIHLKDYADTDLSLSIENFDQRYLCTDSLAKLKLSYNESSFENFQWQKFANGSWQDISGANSPAYSASDSGLYRLTATHVQCSSANIESSPYHVYDYTERPMNVYKYPYSGEICLGDSAKLKLSGSGWNFIQWFEGDIQMTENDGYQLRYIPLPFSDTTTFYVEHFNKYIVKAKHESCPNGLKIASDYVEIRPSVNPDIEVISDIELYGQKPTLLDSANHYLTCDSAIVEYRVIGQYNSYQWYKRTYGYQSEDYSIGDSIPGATNDTLTDNAGLYWYRAVVTDASGCVGVSKPVLMDIVAIESPVVESHYNGELCEGDSTYVNLAFNSDWIEFKWFNNGIEMPNTNTDTLWVTEPGSYIIGARHARCPNEWYTSGVGAPIHYFEAGIYEDTDSYGNEFFFAWPWQGQYEFQWYVNGEPIPSSSYNPAIIYKDSIPSGLITVEITNAMPCTVVSDGVYWEPTGINDIEDLGEFKIYPNPTNGIVNITGLNPETTESISIYSTTGELMLTQNVNSNVMSVVLNGVPKGIYIVQIKSKNGEINTHKIVKQ